MPTLRQRRSPTGTGPPAARGRTPPGIRAAVDPRWIALLCVPFLPACAGDHPVEEPAPLGDAVPIEYPLEMWDQGIEGETVLQVRVNELGEVDSVAVVETSGHESLDSAAAEGARAMIFQPGRRDGRDVPVWVRMPVQFSRQSSPVP